MDSDLHPQPQKAPSVVAPLVGSGVWRPMSLTSLTTFVN